MSAFIDFAQRRFAELGVDARASEDRRFIVARQAGDPDIIIVLHDEGALLTASFQPELKVPEAKLEPLYAYVCAVNNLLRLGALVLSPSSLEFTFKITNLLYSTDFTEDFLRKIMTTGVRTAEDTMKGVRAIVDEGASVEDAVRRLQ
jgi:hypothetical protein